MPLLQGELSVTLSVGKSGTGDEVMFFQCFGGHPGYSLLVTRLPRDAERCGGR